MPGPSRILLIIAAVIAGLLLAAGAVLPLYLGSEHAAAIIREAVNRSIPGSVTWEELTFFFPEGALAVSGAVLFSPEGEETARVERAYLDVALPALLFRRIQVTELLLVRPVARIDAQGGLGGPAGIFADKTPTGAGENSAFPAGVFAQGGEETGGWRLRLDRLEVQGGTLVLRGAGLYLDTGPFDLELRPGPLKPDVLVSYSGRGGYLGAGDFSTVFSADLRARVGRGEVKTLLLQAEARRAGRAWSRASLRAGADFSEALDSAPGSLTGLLDLCSYRFTLRVERLLLQELFPGGPVKGDAVLTAAGAGNGFHPGTLSARVDLDGRLEGFKAGVISVPDGIDLRADARMQSGTFSLEQLRVRGGGASVEASGAYEVAARSVQGTALVEAEDLQRVLLFPGGAPAGSLLLSLQAEGRVANPAVTVRLLGEETGYGGFDLGDIMVEADLKPSGLVTVSELLLEREGGTVSGKGRARLFDGALGRVVPDPPLRADFLVRSLGLGELLPEGTGVDGEVHGPVSVEGSIRSPVGRAELLVRGTEYRGVPLGEAALALSHEGGVLRVLEGTLIREGSVLRLDGDIRLLPGPPAFDLTVAGRDLRLEDYPGLFPEEARGGASLYARLEGGAAEPAVFIRVLAGDLVLWSQPVREAVVAARYRAREVVLEELTAGIGREGTLRAEGRYGLDTGFHVSARGDDIAVQDIEPAGKRGFGGTLAFVVRGDGTLADPDLEGVVRVDEPASGERELQDLLLSFRLREGTVRLWGHMGVEIGGTYRLETGDFTLVLDMDRAPLAPWLRALAPGTGWLRELDGTVTGAVTARGNRNRLEDASATVQLSMLSVTAAGHPVLEADGLDALYRDRQLFLAPARLRLPRGGYLRVEGRAGIGGELDCSVRGSVPLAAAGVFIDELTDVSGTLSLDASLGGTAGRPEPRGELGFRNLELTIPRTGQRVHGLQGVVAVNDQTIELQGIQGWLDTGWFSLSGSVEHRFTRLGAARIELETASVPVRLPRTLEMLVSGNLTLTGLPEESLLEGQLVLLEGVFFRDLGLNDLAAALSRKKEGPLLPPLDVPYLRRVQLQVDVQGRDLFTVDNAAAYLLVSPDLTVSGTLQRPLVNGRADIRSGNFMVRGNRFVVRTGVVDFIDPYAPVPTLDVESRTEIRRYTITLRVMGTPDDLALALSSTPPLPDEDILSLLLVGSTTGELAGSDRARRLPPEQMLAQVMGSVFGGDVERLLGLDMLEIETGNEEEEEEDQEDAPARIQVTVGKELTRRLRVRYAIRTSRLGITQRTTAEYHFLEHLLLKVFQDTRGTYGGELQYRIDFR